MKALLILPSKVFEILDLQELMRIGLIEDKPVLLTFPDDQQDMISI